MIIYSYEHYEPDGAAAGCVYTATRDEAISRAYACLRAGGTDWDEDLEIPICKHTLQPDRQTILNLLNHSGGWAESTVVVRTISAARAKQL